MNSNSTGKKILSIFLIYTLIGVTGCKKYEEGPSLSLLSKTQRFTGTWELSRFFIDDDQVLVTNREELSVKKNGTFTKSTIISNNSFNISGNWEFSEDMESLLMKFSAATIETWVIKRLSNKQLYVEFQTPSSVFRYEYVKKSY